MKDEKLDTRTPAVIKFSTWLDEKRGRAAAICVGSNVLTPVIISKFKSGVSKPTCDQAIDIERMTDKLFDAAELCPVSADRINYIRGSI